MVKPALIGCGIMGKSHAQSILGGKVPGAEWTAVCDVDPATLAWAREKCPGIATFEKTADLFASGTADAVIIATPHYSHPTIALEALENNTHVMVEKPAGVFTKNVREMNAISEREFNRTNTKLFAAPPVEKIAVPCPGDYPEHPGVLAAFVAKIRGTGELYARGEEGINGLTISNAIYLSSWLGKTVELPLDEDLFLSELQKRCK